jgi:RNA polymerase sigma-70 factor (ECF subfamily)
LQTAAQVRLGYMSEATESSLHGSTQESLDFEARFIADNMRRIFRQIYRIVRNVDDAQDLTQEAFIKALQRRDQLKDAEKAAHWLSRIASNTAIDFLRRHGRINFSDIDDLVMPLATAVEESPERLLLRGEQSRYLDGGLSVLTERERLAILLRDVDDLPAEEVAKQLNCSKATVRSHIANARIKLRRYMERRKA